MPSPAVSCLRFDKIQTNKNKARLPKVMKKSQMSCTLDYNQLSEDLRYTLPPKVIQSEEKNLLVKAKSRNKPLVILGKREHKTKNDTLLEQCINPIKGSLADLRKSIGKARGATFMEDEGLCSFVMQKTTQRYELSFIILLAIKASHYVFHQATMVKVRETLSKKFSVQNKSRRIQ